MVCQQIEYYNNNGGEELNDRRKRVTIVGGGNWGSAIACVVGKTVKQQPNTFYPFVNMWCRDSRKPGDLGESIADTINRTHENAKYLPGRKIPDNVIATSNLLDACEQAHILILVVPHQGINQICEQLNGKLLPDAQAVSLTKGISSDGQKLKLISQDIEDALGVKCSVLMGANLAGEVADEKFCEATIGCKSIKKQGDILKQLFDTPNFRIRVTTDYEAVELCGALKNIVACAAGFVDGLGWAYNIKSAMIRLGLLETKEFVKYFYPNSKCRSYFESCGVADLITTCYGGRNRKVAEAFIKSDKPLAQVEKELLNGQSAQGPPTAEDVYEMMEMFGISEKFPIFTAVHKIFEGEMGQEGLYEAMRSHPAYDD